MREMTMVAALNEFFRLPGETLPQFSAELKKLTDKDRADFAAEFEKVGVRIVEKKSAA